MNVLALALLLLVPPGDDVWTGVERVVAVGDVHGDYDQLVAVLRSANLIDAQTKWTGGKVHLVQTGDVLDRGPDSRKAMDLLMRLEVEARDAGGAVHALIGNHEAMNVYGDLRYVAQGEIDAFRDADSEKTREAAYREHVKKLEADLPKDKLPKFDEAYKRAWEADRPLGLVEHRRAFSASGKYGKWILGLNAVIRIDGTLFLHGGISPKYAGWTVRQINDKIREELADFSKMEGGIVQDEHGPLWYRGLALGGEPLLEKHLQTVLSNYKVDRIAIGHTFTEGAISPRFGTRVLMIDIGLSKVYDPEGRLACLVLDQGRPTVLHRGKRLDLPSDADRDLLRYFKEAAALDPQPSPLRGKIADLEARLGR